jgi:hypothetical protein
MARGTVPNPLKRCSPFNFNLGYEQICFSSPSCILRRPRPRRGVPLSYIQGISSPSPQSSHPDFLYQPYGRILDISAPAPLPGTAYRASTIAFSNIRSSVVARNVAHGHYIGQTRLRISFFPPIRVHLIRDWIAKHPRISMPVIFFLLGTLTYTVR